MAYGNTGFKEGSTDVFNRYVSKEYLMEYYPDLLPSKIAPRLWTWGSNLYGQLGDGSSVSRLSPGTTAGVGTNWKQVSVGDSFMAAVKTDGTLWTWGSNISGELGKNDFGGGTGRSSPGTTAGSGTNWKQVSCGLDHAAAIKTDGTLWTWGSNSSGRLGDGTTTTRPSPGTTVGGGTNWKQVSCGYKFTAAIKTDGTLWTWGANDSGSAQGYLGDGTIISRSSPGTTIGGGTNWRQVSCGQDYAAAIKTDGTLWTWGYNNAGELGTGNITARSSPGTTIAGGTNWKQVSAGAGSTAAVKTDGTLWTWGDARQGSLGHGSQTDRSSPGTTAGGGTNWKQVVACNYCMAAIKTDGTLWTWGVNNTGQLGNGNTVSSLSPGTTAGGGTNWKRVADSVTLQLSSFDSTFAAINESGNW